MPRIEMGENPKTGLSGLADAKARKIADIDHATSASILGGFDYMVGEKLLHFSYDSFDQQNFADAASAAILATISADNTQKVIWNGYKTDGTLARCVAALHVAPLGTSTNAIERRRQKQTQ